MYAKLTVLLKKGMIFFMLCFGITSLYTLIYIPHLSDTFRSDPQLFLVPLAALLCIANVPRLASKRKYSKAFLFSSLTISLLLVLVAIEIYPNLLVSTSNPSQTITVYNAASSDKSLGIMLTFAAIGTPLVIGYTAFVYITFRGKVRIDDTSY
jgi:cytochrome d ubiquinol oxidase subunit II